MHLEHQKLGMSIKDRQTSIFDLLDQDDKARVTDKSIEYQGINFSGITDRVFRGIQKLLNDSCYRSNIGKWIRASTPSWIFNPKLPIFKFTLPELYDACGMRKYHTARGKMEYSGKEVQLIIRGLKELTQKTHFIYYTRKHWEKREKEEDVIRLVTPVLNIKWIWEGIEHDEYPKGRKVSSIKVIPSPILIDQLEDYHVLRPAKLHSEVKKKFPTDKGYTVKLIDFLFVQAREKKFKTPLIIEMNYKEIGAKLGMDGYIKRRQWNMMRQSLTKIYSRTQELGYLLDYKTDKKGKTGISLDQLTINPEKVVFVKKETEKR